MAVEIVNLEVMLARLLGPILRLRPKVADAIYFAPQATGPRIAVMIGATREALKLRPDYLELVDDLLKKARDYANKRNDILHQSWGLSDTTGKISTRPLPFTDTKPARYMPVSEIEDNIYNIRVLIGRVRALALQIGDDTTYWPSLKTLPELIRREMAHTRNLLITGVPEPEPPPESSRE